MLGDLTIFAEGLHHVIVGLGKLLRCTFHWMVWVTKNLSLLIWVPFPAELVQRQLWGFQEESSWSVFPHYNYGVLMFFFYMVFVHVHPAVGIPYFFHEIPKIRGIGTIIAPFPVTIAPLRLTSIWKSSRRACECTSVSWKILDNLEKDQWEFQDPKMEVLYHIRPYFLGTSPYIGLKHRPYIWNRYLQSIGSWNGHWKEQDVMNLEIS
jgi:hypothetical protein